MSRVNASAPGKIVVCGEYAVLHDSPAIGMAVDRRVQVTVESTDGPRCSVRTEGFNSGKFIFDVVRNGALNWIGASGPVLVAELMSEFDGPDNTHFDICIDSHRFFDATTGRKFGIGSSASVAVALSAALGEYFGETTGTLRRATDAHRRFQGKKGSGIDVATSYSGGLIRYRMARDHKSLPMSWPRDLNCRILWSGTSASTVDKIARTLDIERDDRTLRSLADQSRLVADRWSSGIGSEVLRSMENYIDALMAFDDEHELGIFDAGHRGLVDTARNRGVVYKPCGAGGGDTGMALTLKGAGTFQDFAQEAASAGFRVLDARIDQDGVVLHKEGA